MTALAMNSASVVFGGLRALNDVSLSLGEPGIFGLIGPNGAGKSTCINVLTGLQELAGGSVTLAGKLLDRVSPREIRRRGVSRTFQAGRLFSKLTVHENLVAAAIGLGQSRKGGEFEASQILAWMGLEALSPRMADALPYTDQRRVAIARAIVGKPSVLLLDEPAAGMSAAETRSLAELLLRIVSEMKTSVLLVEHNIAFVVSVCSSITVLDGGAVIAWGRPDDIRRDERVREAYLGSSLDRTERLSVR